MGTDGLTLPHGYQAEFIIAEESWQQRRKGAGSLYIGRQKAESDGGLCSVPSSSDKGPKATKCWHPILGSFLPPQLNQSRTSLTKVSRNLLSIP